MLDSMDRAVEERLLREKAELEHKLRDSEVSRRNLAAELNGKLRNSETTRRTLAATCTRRTEELSRVQDELVAARSRILALETDLAVAREKLGEELPPKTAGGFEWHNRSAVADAPEYRHPRRGVVVACQGDEDGDVG
jgi:predicted  nucleic acid-binding Zn-ribbon protein